MLVLVPVQVNHPPVPQVLEIKILFVPTGPVEHQPNPPLPVLLRPVLVEVRVGVVGSDQLVLGVTKPRSVPRWSSFSPLLFLHSEIDPLGSIRYQSEVEG